MTPNCRPELRIDTVTVRVPIDLPPSEREQADDPHLAMEIYDGGCRVWDSATYTACGDAYSFTDAFRLVGFARDRLPDIPYFDQVYRFLVDRHAAHRNDPLGRFIAPAVEAMDAALSERSGSRVYFAQAGARIKIGWSRNVAARIAQLQTGNAEPVRLVATTPGARSLERQLHERFADTRVAGEWFEATPELVAYVDDLNLSEATSEAVHA